ncbi:MAG: DUF885 domain-containing protein, partial [Planctomycetota bacterium]
VALLAAPAAGRDDADAKLLALLREDFEAQLARSPTWASTRGDRRYDDRWEDVGPAAGEAWVADARARLEALGRIPREGLSPGNRVNAALLEHELAQRVEGERFHAEQLAVTQISGPQISVPQLPEWLSFTAPEHFAAFLKRLEALPAHLDATAANLRAGLKAGRTPPKGVIGAAAQQALVHAGEDLSADPTRHALYLPFRKLAPDEPVAAAARLAVRERVVPAFRRFGEFLRDEYIPGCRDSIAASDGPDGRAYYDFRLRTVTTTPLGADEIHALGLAEVARIRGEMEAAMKKTGFAGAVEEFVEKLRADPRFFHGSAAELLRGYRDICKRADAELPRLFGRLPRLSYGVREMPAYIAPASPTAYYYRGSRENGVPGWFVANTYRLDQRPKYEMVPLALHEAVPGHHLQIALAQELEGLPEWRTTLGYTVFVEGWGLYAERLGIEMGLYADPYDDFGRLSYEMWRALRLVVDTGIHAKGWSRERAIETMLANAALTRENVEREVDRYIAWPGQAVAYKIGERKIRELRARAEKALGPRFDVRGFHDAVLGEGAVPLSVLEENVEAWIASRR